MKKPTPFGKYYLLERINVGGMAEVFRSKAFGVEGFERLVAVKRILPNIAEDKEFIRMFIEEAKLAVQLNHANIAQIFDLGVVDGSYYIALEHVHGRDLRVIFERCRGSGEPMPVAQACFVIMKVCEGLDYAHNKRDQSGRELSLVHRDVSPQNVLVSFEGEVKLIDFGIAKAAGKGSKTQAGILKGKFGYMSPEQVRGLPVDRRSDVFSCGIVLYELLTGERLFVGESDFSTLEKVRNVEILPPSTYNRRIPDELERIVLKALAKDTEDRYQNAIDLHDELQAFVYTAGEFYSRKDLAGWMKKCFGKEIEEETAKLEGYRQLKPEMAAPPPGPRTITGSRPPVHTPKPELPVARRTSTQTLNAVGAVGTKPPPPPTRVSQEMKAITAPPKKRTDESGDLAWDEDELETQIYDNPEDQAAAAAAAAAGRPARTSKPLPLSAPPPSQPGMAAADGAGHGPDLSSLAPATARAWDQNSVPPGATLNGMGGNGAPQKFPSGSNKVPTPMEPPPHGMMARGNEPSGVPVLFDSAPNPYPLAPPPPSYPNEPQLLFDPMASFGQGVVQNKKGHAGLWIALAGLLVAGAAVAVVLVVTNSSDKAPTEARLTPPAPGSAAPGSNPTPAPGSAVPGSNATPGAPIDPNTGFDLYVTPSGMTQWKLDGEARADKLPSRIRGIAPGKHTVQIDPPPGFMSQSQTVSVETGKATRVDITLPPIQGIQGVFESMPPGATVSLIVDGKRQQLGASPQKSPLDPRNTYQVLFEKSGYVSVNKPITFTGSMEEKVVVNLEKAATVASGETTKVTTPPTTTQQKTTPPTQKTTTTAKVEADKEPKGGGDDTKETKTPPAGGGTTSAAKSGTGTLPLNAKPPCEIFVDGVASNQHTPLRMTLPAGKHRITLINNEFGIKETFSVDVHADTVEKLVFKDYSDRLPK